MREERGNVHFIPLSLYEEGLCQALRRTPSSRAQATGIFGKILDHPDIYPDSRTWCDSLFYLAVLEHEDAMAPGPDQPAMRTRAREHLEEWLARYPQDPRLPQAQWMLGFLAFEEGDWTQAALAFRKVTDHLHHAPQDPQEPSLTMGRAAALLAAEAVYREGLRTGHRTHLTMARDAFLEARDLNQGTWRAPWALARMGDCAQALGLKEEASKLRQEAAWEYGQIGLAAGPPPEGMAGIQALVTWRTEALQELGGP
jgi:tetratricopeptide (TPR) repeat protein